MPAKIMKRPAAAAAVSAAPMKRPAAKKAKLDPVAEKCNVVSEAILEAENLPDNTKTMLSDCLSSALGVYKSERHEYQNWVIEMVSEVVMEINAGHKKVMSDTKAELEGIEEVKVARSAKATDLAAKLAAAKEAVTQAESKEQSDEKAVKEAEISLTTANVALKEATEALSAKVTEKEALQETFDNKYKPLKSEEDRPAGVDDSMKDIIKKFEELNVEKSLCESFKMIAVKKPSEWGSFDHVVVGQIDAAFSQGISKLEGEAQEAETLKTTKQEAASAAEAHLEKSKELHAASLAAFKQGVEKAQELEKESEIAQKAVADFNSDLKAICDRLDSATATESEFAAGPVAALDELKELAPPPEPEFMAEEVPMPDEEAVEEAKAEVAKSLEEFPLAGGGCPPPPELAQGEEATMVDAQVPEAAMEPKEGE